MGDQQDQSTIMARRHVLVCGIYCTLNTQNQNFNENLRRVNGQTL